MVPYSTLNIENAIKDLLDKKVDIIFTGMSEMKIARALAGDTPIIVMAGGVNQLGLVRPDGTSGENVAYVDTTNPDTAGDRLRKFGELAPNLKRIAVFRGIEGTPGEYGLAMADMQAVAKELGLTLTDKQFADRKEFNKYMIEEANFTEVDAIFRYPSPFIATNVDIIFAFRATIDLPIVGLNKQELTQGALMAYGPDYEEIGALASEIAYEILVDGKNAGEIVYKKPSRMYLGINEEDAIRHNLVIPQSISSKIDYRIEN
jgi:ABC-type uncharacterized transport system substrate-binding protein